MATQLVRAHWHDQGMSCNPIDLSSRPESYFWDLGAESALLNHKKGGARREALQQLISQGQRAQIPEFLSRRRYLTKSAQRSDGSTRISRVGSICSTRKMVKLKSPASK